MSTARHLPLIGVSEKHTPSHLHAMPAAESAMPLMIAALLGMFSAVTAALFPTPEAGTMVTGMDDQRMLLICMSASLGGAVMSVIFFPLAGVKDMARKLVGSSLAGFIFAPMILRKMDWAHDLPAIIGVSGATALLSWGILQWFVPAAPKMAASLFSKWFGSQGGDANTKQMKP